MDPVVEREFWKQAAQWLALETRALLPAFRQDTTALPSRCQPRSDQETYTYDCEFEHRPLRRAMRHLSAQSRAHGS
jgi:hypothetical protein